MSLGPSPHLFWSELACSDGTDYPDEWRGPKGRAVRLAEAFEALRTECGGRPIAVISGYRTRAVNEAVGGAKASEHLYGRALDLAAPRGLSLRAFRDAALRLTATTAIRGVGYYPDDGHLHIDVRPGAVVHQWTTRREERA